MIAKIENLKEEVNTNSLIEAIKRIAKEIEECESILECTESRKEELQLQLRETMTKAQEAIAEAQEQFADVLGERQKKHPRSGMNRHGQKSVRSLIVEYLQKHGGEARTSEIRQMLRTMDRDTNPGVELSRMVKDGSLKKASERGLYALRR